MATAANFPSAEGKTIDVTSERMCDVCENEEAIKYCLKCPGSLCATCTTSHLRVKMTKDHTLCDINDVLNAEESKTKLSKCPKHLNKTFECYCRDCGCFICEDCKDDHQNHVVLTSEEEDVLYQTAYHNHMKILLENVYDLKCYKKIIEETIKSYEEACDMVDDWESELINYIREKAKDLRQELELIKSKLEYLIHDKQNGVETEIDGAEQSIKKLRDASNVTDTNILSKAVRDSQNILDRLARYKANIISRTRVPKVTEILSNIEEKEPAKETVKLLFSMDAPNCTPLDLGLGSLERICEEVISNPNGSQGYRFCKSPLLDSVVIYGKDTKDIRILDDKLNVMKQVTCDFLVWKMTTVYPNKHIAIHTGYQKMSLLDEHFKIVETMEAKEEYIRSIEYISPHRFIKCCIREKNVYLAVILVKEKTFLKENEIKVEKGVINPWYMAYDQVKDQLALFSQEGIHRFSTSLTKRTDHILRKELSGELWSIGIDNNENVLAGTQDGNIHLFTALDQHRVLTKMDNPVRDLSVKNGRLLVSTKNNKLYIFTNNK